MYQIYVLYIHILHTHIYLIHHPVLLQVTAVYQSRYLESFIIWSHKCVNALPLVCFYRLHWITSAVVRFVRLFIRQNTMCSVCNCARRLRMSMTQGSITNSKNKNLINFTAVRCNSLTYWAACRLQAIWFNWPYAIMTHRKHHRWVNHSTELNHTAFAASQKPQAQAEEVYIQNPHLSIQAVWRIRQFKKTIDTMLTTKSVCTQIKIFILSCFTYAHFPDFISRLHEILSKGQTSHFRTLTMCLWCSKWIAIF